MGLFTKEEKVDYNVPLSLRMKATADKTQQQFTDTYLDPAIKENIGYESPRMKMKALTSGVDLTDGKAVQKVFMELQAMDPQEANGWLQSIKPVIAQHLDSIKIKESQLKFTKTKNKPLIDQRWSLEGKPNFILSHVTTNFAGLEGAEDLQAAIAKEPKRAEFFVNSFLNSMDKDSDKKALSAEYKANLKAAKTTYSDYWGGKDNLDVDLKAKPTTKNVKLKDTGTDTTAPDAFHTADPSKSQLSQGLSSFAASARMRETLSTVNAQLTGFMPEFLMTDSELEAENVKDDIQDWIMDGGAETWFKTKSPQALGAFKSDPVKYWKTNKPKGK